MKKTLVQIPVSKKQIEILVKVKRLTWAQRSDPLAVSKAISKLFKDMAESKLSLKDWAKQEGEKLRRDSTT